MQVRVMPGLASGYMLTGTWSNMSLYNGEYPWDGVVEVSAILKTQTSSLGGCPLWY